MATDQVVEALRASLLDNQQLRQENRRLAERAREPVAIIGMACRFPGGVRTPEDLWDLLVAERDGVTGVPADRGWNLPPAEPGEPPLRGGFLRDAMDFDPGFFGISPREALAMDPQQRLLLEVCWEAVERAGIDPQGLRGGDTAVYAGVLNSDYGTRLGHTPEDLAGFLGTGTIPSVVSGRISYLFGLEGPAVSLDTACSSSLVAIHLACQALRSGDTALALAGGVTVMNGPGVLSGAWRQGGLARDGRCKSFSASADGAAFGEGVGVVLLERLGDARRHGHPVLAVVRGSAVNQDGASNGLTAPNGPAQCRVLRKALRNAGLAPADVDALEAHGTGTVLGDPIEAQAVLEVYGRDRPAGRPLLMGSLKSNLTHTQAAAGVGGVIKMVLAMRHGLLPRSLHIDRPSDRIDWGAGDVALLSSAMPWPDTGRPHRAAVSSFGASGTNAHVVLESAPATEDDVSAPRTDGPTAWILSARTPAALRAQATRLHAHVTAHPDLHPADVGLSLALGRSRFGERAVLVGADRAELLTALDAFARADGDGVDATTAPKPGRVVFVFPGLGAEWPGMARELLDSSPAFAARMADCARALAAHLDWSPLAVLRCEPGAPTIDAVEVLQPVLFSVLVSLAAVWQAHGIEPAAVIGHSQGEVAAACVAGILSLEDAAAIAVLRSRALATVTGGGAMATVLLSAAEAEKLIDEYDGRLSIAAVNGPRVVVLGGAADALDALLADADDIMAFRTPIDYAPHSADVDPVRDNLIAALAAVTPGAGTVPMLSTVDADWVRPGALGPRYWFRNLRETVRFHDAVRVLFDAGYRTFVEVSPHPTLTFNIQDAAAEAALDGLTVLETLRRDEGDARRLLTALGRAHVSGLPIDWRPVFDGSGARRVDLPTYAFQRQRYWLDPTLADGDPADLGQADPRHPLLRAAVELPDAGGTVFTGRLSVATQPWLADHAVRGTVLLPGVACLEMAAHVGRRFGCDLIEEFVLAVPLIVPDEADRGVQLRLTVGAPDRMGRRTVEIHSRPEDVDAEWTGHGSGVLAPDPVVPPPASRQAHWPPSGARAIAIDQLYSTLDTTGVEYGPAFRGLRTAWSHGEEILAEAALPAAVADGFGLHPALFDALLHTVTLRDPDPADDKATSGVPLPFSWHGVRIWSEVPAGAVLRAVLRPEGADAVSLEVTDESGRPVVTVGMLTMRTASFDSLRAPTDALFRVEWSRLDGPATPPGRWAILGDADDRLVGDLPGVGDDRTGLDAVLLPCPPSGADTPAAVHATTAAVLHRLHAWLARPAADCPPLVVVTRGAVDLGEEPLDIAAAAVWGLVRSAQQEHPDRFVLLDTDNARATTELLATVLAAGEPQAALRAGAVFAPRLARVRVPATPDECFGVAGTVLLTGGTGTLGGILARHLVARHGVRHLLLLGRRGPAAEPAELVADLTAMGAHVTVESCDVTDRAAVDAALARIPQQHPLTAIVHAAGVLDDAVLSEVTPQRLSGVLRPKVDGAWNLHEATKDMPLRAFVVYSSLAGLFGGPGQSAYAAANLALDALMAARHRRGLPAKSLAWGLWEQRSDLTATLSEADLRRMARSGVHGLTAETGAALFDAAFAVPDPVLVPADLDLAAFRTGPVPPLLRALVRATGPARPATDDRLRDRLAAADPDEQLTILRDTVRLYAAQVLGHTDAAAVGPEDPFLSLGFDSLTALELRNRLAAALGVNLLPTVVFSSNTPAKLAELVRAQWTSGPTPAPATQDSPSAAATGTDPVATLFRQLCLRGKADEAIDLIKNASALRAEFHTPAELRACAEPPELVRFTVHADAPELICHGSLVALGGGHQYARFVAQFRGAYGASALSAPGFLPGERVPATMAAMLAYQAEEIVERLDRDRPLILLGSSSGGIVAHGVAAQLEQRGVRPAAVVLLDTYLSGNKAMTQFNDVLLRGMFDREDQAVPMDDTRLTAMGAYFRLLDDYRPPAVQAPTLLVRASDPLGESIPALGDWRSSWPGAHTVVDVPGDHFSMLERHAATTGGAVSDWLDSILS
ncbi:SDR family NAD(P)-dependent oxidoreductase [Nocardia terpenica]|uniref:type I polyketide synthase n=1 Tax=Nocardia terpenica TaxID=455432 RepID=UPI001895C336|nr:type I polyketide synthase [Nocardia terpenica]MBF6059300.1 SDR family NAD(P)-dependent oxidoreductase [Nocardia terpenica]MBF6103161.1 SDR family NAD(P)-dependent oxidoreductase [Nocardia terpenica]MBF6110650.1 SDR family NAD(P)-dependent oxidoreductase [Nocardia terpenica]MBF6116781.1 SDR family NAD(P)-dependent oxidoreductase [Nocardia terpenica]